MREQCERWAQLSHGVTMQMHAAHAHASSISYIQLYNI